MARQRIIKTRLFLSPAVILVGTILLIYGSMFRTIDVVKGPAGDTPPVPVAKIDQQNNILTLSEFRLVQDITIGGVTRWDIGALQRTYGGTPETDKQVKPASLCPT